jgi:hypothetical protein
MRFNVLLPGNMRRLINNFSIHLLEICHHCQEIVKKCYNVVIVNAIISLIYLALCPQSTYPTEINTNFTDGRGNR